MNATFLSIVYFVGFSQALMLTVALWRRSHSGAPGRLLCIFMAIMAYNLFDGGSEYSGFYNYVPHLLNLMPLMVMILGPVLYAYVRMVTENQSFSAKHWLIHLAPWILMWLFFHTGEVFRSADLKIKMYESISNIPADAIVLFSVETIIKFLTAKIHLATYLYLSWKGMNKFSKTVHHLRSDNSQDILSQLRFLIMAFIFLEVVWIVLFLVFQYAEIGSLLLVNQIWNFLIAAVVVAIGYSGLQNPNMVFTRQESLLSEKLVQNKESIQHVNSRVKYILTELPESTTNEIALMIETALQKDKIYLKDKLTLTDLANHIKMKPHTVSQVINQGMKTNFYKLINSYRVQHAIDLIDEESINLSIERIALEAGFSNRVTFNKAFKEQMQCTASEYKKQSTIAS